MRREAVRFEAADGSALVGVLRRPDEGGATAVITVHGWGANRIGPNNLLSDFCRRLCEEGFTTLCFDLRGRGDSEGDPASVTIDDMMDDVVKAAELVRKAGAERVVLFGLCSGGNAALGAATCGAEPDAVVAVSTFPFVPIEDMKAGVKKTSSYLKGYFLKLFRLSTWRKLFRGAVSFKGVFRTLFGHFSKAERKADRALKDTRRDLPEALKGFRGEIVHVYASADPESAPSRDYFERFYRRRGLRASFHTIERTNHNFYGLEARRELFALLLETARRTDAAQR